MTDEKLLTAAVLTAVALAFLAWVLAREVYTERGRRQAAANRRRPAGPSVRAARPPAHPPGPQLRVVDGTGRQPADWRSERAYYRAQLGLAAKRIDELENQVGAAHQELDAARARALASEIEALDTRVMRITGRIPKVPELPAAPEPATLQLHHYVDRAGPIVGRPGHRRPVTVLSDWSGSAGW